MVSLKIACHALDTAMAYFIEWKQLEEQSIEQRRSELISIHYSKMKRRLKLPTTCINNLLEDVYGTVITNIDLTSLTLIHIFLY